jgi:hypothetical protein
VNEEVLICEICGATIPKAAAPGSGWGLYGLPADTDMIVRMHELQALSEGEDPFAHLREARLSMRCRLCVMGAIAASLQLDLDEYPEFAEGLDHYRRALLRREQDL